MMKEKRACRPVSTPKLKSISKSGGYLRNMVKKNCILRVTLSHPYIGTENANCFHEMRCRLRRSLVMMWTVEMELRHDPVR